LFENQPAELIVGAKRSLAGFTSLTAPLMQPEKLPPQLPDVPSYATD
jgi:hypothetical protein